MSICTIAGTVSRAVNGKNCMFVFYKIIEVDMGIKIYIISAYLPQCSIVKDSNADLTVEKSLKDYFVLDLIA